MLIVSALLYFMIVICNGDIVLGEDRIYCVKPSNSDTSCTNASSIFLCEDFNYYASNATFYFSNDTTLEFLPGEHYLNVTNVSISYVNNLKWTGESLACIPTKSYPPSSSKNAKITCMGEVGILFLESQNLTISHLSFIHCGQSIPPTFYTKEYGEAMASLAFSTVENLVLSSLRISNSSGYGLLMHNVYGHSIISTSEFLYNKGGQNHRGGNAILNYSSCSLEKWTGADIEILDSTFSFGGYTSTFNDTHNTGVFATGIAVTLSCSGINILMQNVTVEGNLNDNKIGYGGNLYIHFYNERQLISNKVQISDSKFLSGSSRLGGGIGISFLIGASSHNTCQNTVSIKNSVLNENRASTGSGLYMNAVQKLLLNNCTANIRVLNCTLSRNEIYVKKNSRVSVNAGVVTLVDDRLSGSLVNFNTFNVLLDTVTVDHSRVDIADYQRIIWGNAALHIYDFMENLRIENSQFKHNNMSAISAYHSLLTFSGSNWLYNNSGVNGGGMILCESSSIILTPNTNITLKANHALHSGGGIYAGDSCSGTIPLCFYQIDDLFACGVENYKNLTQVVVSCNISVTMISNTAEYAGNHIYGGSVGNCFVHASSFSQKQNIFGSVFHLEGPSNDLSSITSSPMGICFCSNSTFKICSVDVMLYPQVIYPGQSVTFYMVIVGQLNGTVPGSLRVNTSADGSYTIYNT